MAFTIAHMAAALPFYRSQRWLNFEALLIGTMLPDIPYFLDFNFLSSNTQNHINTIAHQSHYWSGLLRYGLPLGVLAFILWYWWFRPAAIALIQPWSDKYLKYPNAQDSTFLPIDYSLKARLTLGWQKHLTFWIQAVVGLLLGGFTHLIWDGTTHANGFIAEQVSWLQQTFTITFLGKITVARLLQYLSSLLGLGLLFWFVLTKFRVHKSVATHYDSHKHPISYKVFSPFALQKHHSLVIISLILISALVCSLQAALKWHMLLINHKYYFLVEVSVSFVKCAGLLFTIYSLIYQVFVHFRKFSTLLNS